MSEVLHSREYRQQQLQQIIHDLHQGATVEEVKSRFHELIKDVGPAEIANLEQALIQEGLPEQEIKRLCDVHVAVFKESLDQQVQAEQIPGHPLHTFRQENEAVLQLLSELEPLLQHLDSQPVTEQQLARWRDLHQRLLPLELHYSRKENVLFPYLEQYGISGPPSVMWSIHDEIRTQLKSISQTLATARAPSDGLTEAIRGVALPMLNAIREMIYKEEKILFPMSLELLTEAEWAKVQRDSGEIGYTLIQPGNQWKPKTGADAAPKPAAAQPPGVIELDVGALTPLQLNQLLRALPLDITFVDAENVVRYFSQGKERIFTRTPAIIGRQVAKCHPPESVHVVERIVREFQAGEREQAEFWIELGGKFIYIRYFPVRDDQGQYLGVLEVTQDVTAIRQLQGQQRLLDEDTP